jgi:hypothetical protein
MNAKGFRILAPTLWSPGTPATRAQPALTDSCPDCGGSGYDGDYCCTLCGHEADSTNGATLSPTDTQTLRMMRERANRAIDSVRTLEHAADAAHRAGTWQPAGAASYLDYVALARAEDQRRARH